jgi:Ser/Thr protein kinase RdoA (MazF antagonist)
MKFDLNPDAMIGAVENAAGRTLTGLVSPLTSYINRVYELRSKEGEKLIVKFYRPGRWSREAILDEHAFLNELNEAELPVVPPLTLRSGTTLDQLDSINFAVFPKKAGRQLEINSFEDWLRLGALTARMHAAGSQHKPVDRITIHPLKSTSDDLEYLRLNVLPPRFTSVYGALVTELINRSVPLFESVESIRIHGDLHRGNILDRMDEGLLVIDFDDMAVGPPVQDLWLLLPDRLENAREEAELFIEGYDQFRSFDRKSLKCIEPLRAMRMIYFLAWCSRQAGDPQFRRNFPDWGSDSFWQKEINDLQEQLGFVRDSA